MAGITRQTEQTIGIVSLAMMALFLVLALTTFDGTPTVLFIVAAVIFLVVGLVLMGGFNGTGSSGGQSQQQSVVMSDGQVITQQSGVQVVCTGCGQRAPEGSQYCPSCGHAMGA